MQTAQTPAEAMAAWKRRDDVADWDTGTEWQVVGIERGSQDGTFGGADNQTRSPGTSENRASRSQNAFFQEAGIGGLSNPPLELPF
jgi:transcription elongation factor